MQCHLRAEHACNNRKRKAHLDGIVTTSLPRAKRLPLPVLRLLVRTLRHRPAERLTLRPEEMAGRRVLILGPARCGPESGGGGPFAVRRDRADEQWAGSAAFRPRPRPAALRPAVSFVDEGPVTLDELRRAGEGMLVHRTPTRGAFFPTVVSARPFASANDVRCLPLQRYRALSAQLGGRSPTTGLVAARSLPGASMAELAVVGFTFFQTSYCPDYDAAVVTILPPRGAFWRRLSLLPARRGKGSPWNPGSRRRLRAGGICCRPAMRLHNQGAVA